MQAMTQQKLLPLTLGALGVVYGDIGTSPLYTMKEVFAGTHPVLLNHDNVLGILSLIFWSLMFVVSLKYVVFIMRADNNGEGGIMALMALAMRTLRISEKQKWLMMLLGLAGAALFYGDGVITPAISVLSAVEGLDVATPLFRPYIIPITLAVLAVLFYFQSRGTGSIGRLFGPVMLLWFLTLGVLGIINIAKEPQVLQALNPYYGLHFFQEYQFHAFLALGAVVLALTGAEALYADMGHFGRSPVQLAWFFLVLPALVLNYFGQGALILDSPEAIQNPFYLLVPEWGVLPMVALSTVATVIASQAVISGAFSITRQAIQLGYLPRFEIQQTSEEEIGQIYVPGINWMLLISVVALVIGFKTSTNLAAAYGIAVTGTMLITTILAFVVVRHVWHWGWLSSAVVIALFMVVDLAFLGANAVKFLDGGWFPLAMGALIFLLMSTWKRGRALLAAKQKDLAIALEDFFEGIKIQGPARVTGTAVFLTTNPYAVPSALLHNVLHNKVLHERVILLSISVQGVPHVPRADRTRIEDLENNFFRVMLNYGFKDDINIPRELGRCTDENLKFNMMMTTFFLGRETLVASARPGMALWREKLFISMFRSSASAMSFFKLPTNRVIELGTQVEI
ncbi:MAG TPA: potassium transporter Kup [Gallionellaceae bacterium]